MSLPSRCTLLGLLLAGCAPAAIAPTLDAAVDVPAPAETGAIDEPTEPDARPTPVVDASPPRDAVVSPTVDATSAARCSGRLGRVGTYDREVVTNGMVRHAWIHVPGSYDPTVPVPLILDFHGLTSNPREQENYTHLHQVSDERGFIAVEPQSVVGSWNAGACCGTAVIGNIDDVRYTRDLLDLLESDYCIDRTRVYAMGFSNGGFFVYRLACEMADTFAAIAPVSGQVGVTPCRPTRAIPVLHTHGTADLIVPYAGNPLLNYVSVDQSLQVFRLRNVTEGTGHAVLAHGATTCTQWDAPRTGAEVIHCRVENGGHDWPGGGSRWVDGGRPDAFVATDTIVEFFDRHTLPR